MYIHNRLHKSSNWFNNRQQCWCLGSHYRNVPPWVQSTQISSLHIQITSFQFAYLSVVSWLLIGQLPYDVRSRKTRPGSIGRNDAWNKWKFRVLRWKLGYFLKYIWWKVIPIVLNCSHYPEDTMNIRIYDWHSHIKQLFVDKNRRVIFHPDL